LVERCYALYLSGMDVFSAFDIREINAIVFIQ
jgi:hypothetical protein